MGFMQKQIEYGYWYEVDGINGIEVVPADLVPHSNIYPDEWYTLDGEDDDSELYNFAIALEDYLETSVDRIHALRVTLGWGARLSAPGFMDCTAWTVFKTREEAEEFLREEYDVEEEETEDD